MKPPTIINCLKSCFGGFNSPNLIRCSFYPSILATVILNEQQHPKLNEFTGELARFQSSFEVSTVISRLVWFCIATLCDWLNNLAPLS